MCMWCKQNICLFKVKVSLFVFAVRKIHIPLLSHMIFRFIVCTSLLHSMKREFTSSVFKQTSDWIMLWWGKGNPSALSSAIRIPSRLYFGKKCIYLTSQLFYPKTVWEATVHIWPRNVHHYNWEQCNIRNCLICKYVYCTNYLFNSLSFSVHREVHIAAIVKLLNVQCRIFNKLFNSFFLLFRSQYVLYCDIRLANDATEC